ncbi:MAG: hypothetical protein FWB77_04030 [Treponema sp.]|nr:hypothetical protein [Treponema sp.]
MKFKILMIVIEIFLTITLFTFLSCTRCLTTDLSDLNTHKEFNEQKNDTSDTKEYILDFSKGGEFFIIPPELWPKEELTIPKETNN